MLPADQHPTLAELRRLSTLRQMDRTALNQLANRLRIQRAGASEILLARGSAEQHTLYLLEGRIRLTASDGKVKELSHNDPSAKDPIARLRPSHYEVRSLSPVNYLWIDNELLDSLGEQRQESSTLLEYEVSDEPEFQSMPADNRLMIRIYQDLNEDKLSLPSLPQIASRIGHAMKDPALDANKLAMLISADAAIAAKLLKAANSARFGGKVPVSTLPNAIARLGLDNTHNMVLAFVLRDLFKTGSGTLKKHMRDLWRHSRQVAAISHVLASKVDDNFDPCFALLAGLLHDVGEIALLSYARQCPDLTQVERELEITINKLKPQLGSAIIRSWHLPEELARVSHEAENWDRDPGEDADYTDLVIIAQLHSYVGTKDMYHSPRIDQVPAYKKLRLGELTPDFSLKLLKEASAEIREVEALLGD
jgi:HD-like signal output (HDOD) protein